MRYAGKIRLQHTHRIYTDLTAEVSEESRKKFEQIIQYKRKSGKLAQRELAVLSLAQRELAPVRCATLA